MMLKVVVGLASVMLLQLCTASPSVTVFWDSTFQTIEGFGASNAFISKKYALSPEEAELFFSPEKGIGLSLLRVQVPADGSCLEPSMIACSGGPHTVSDIRYAHQYGVKIWATPWSPPVQFKSNQALVGGTLQPESYPAYARYLHTYIQSIKNTTDVNLYALSVQNEPNARVTYASAAWNPEQFFNFVDNHLGPELASTSVKLIIPESASFNIFLQWGKTWGKQKETLSKFVDILAFHNYDGRLPSPKKGGDALDFVRNRSLWQTEICGLGAYRGPRKGQFDPSVQDGLSWAVHIHKFLVRANVNAWHFWWLTSWLPPKYKSNQSLIKDGQIASRLFTIGMFSKFVRPGFVRVETSTDVPVSGVYVSAFKDQEKFVVVAINTKKRPVWQRFDFSHEWNRTVQVEPWITANGTLMQKQERIRLNRTWFQYMLGSQSVTTFVSSF